MRLTVFYICAGMMCLTAFAQSPILPDKLSHDSGELCLTAYQKRHYEQAFPLCENAAHEGVLAAQNRLGDLHFFGYGIPKNYKKALFWYEKAAEKGYTQSQNNLAYMFH